MINIILKTSLLSQSKLYHYLNRLNEKLFQNHILKAHVNLLDFFKFSNKNSFCNPIILIVTV